jgi:hypothetical protein
MRCLQITPKSAAIAGDGLNQQINQCAQQQHRQGQINQHPAGRKPSRAGLLDAVAHDAVDFGASKKALKEMLQQLCFHGPWILVK